MAKRALVPLLLGGVAAVGMTLASVPTEARPFRVGQIPSGDRFECGNCHVAPAGSGPRNVFGTMVEEDYLEMREGRLSVDWGRDLAGEDADGDGYTNGEELGDPDGSWDGRPIRDFEPSHPGDASQTLCGDREVNGPEDCDGSDTGGATCLSLGRGEGTLRCRPNCTFDVSSCAEPATCGDGIIQAGEDCDGTQLAGATCEVAGLDAGELACNDDCTFDSSGCFASVCGDETVEGAEECDGTTDETCESLGLEPGTIACADDCTIDTSGCGGGGDVCGDGVVNGTEECDGEELGDATCEDLGFDGGTVSCTDECEIDDTECTVSTCGDGVIDEGEECDGEELDGQACTDFDFDGGEISCAADCTFDLAGCSDEEGDVGADVGPDAAEDTGASDASDDANEGSGDAGDAGDDVSSGGGGGGGGGCATAPAGSPWGIAGLIALLGLRRRRDA